MGLLLADMHYGVLRDWIDSAVKLVRFVGYSASFQGRTSKRVSMLEDIFKADLLSKHTYLKSELKLTSHIIQIFKLASNLGHVAEVQAASF